MGKIDLDVEIDLILKGIKTSTMSPHFKSLSFL